MKLAPITIARRAPFRDSMIAWQSASEAQRMDMRLVSARDRQPHRLRTRRQQQAVERNIATACDSDVACLGIDRDDLCIEPQIDTGFSVEVAWTQRKPIFWFAASEMVL
jgi:hypothetical protein